MLYIQLLGVLAFVFLLVGFWLKSKNGILMMHLLANAVFAVHYFLLGAISGGSICTVVVFSDFFLRNKKSDKEMKRHGIIFSILFLLVGLLTASNALTSIPIIAAIFTMYLLLKGEANDIRLGMVFVSLMWAFYAYTVGSYSVLITEVILAISNTFAYNKYKKKKNR
ncbi:MAG: YgjV family protein [Bacilli bacterium]|nr:YgjV family protein [Bacilli bacterium]MDD4809006.1 YgjV family protein [Bacilli bacterium]